MNADDFMKGSEALQPLSPGEEQVAARDENKQRGEMDKAVQQAEADWKAANRSNVPYNVAAAAREGVDVKADNLPARHVKSGAMTISGHDVGSGKKYLQVVKRDLDGGLTIAAKRIREDNIRPGKPPPPTTLADLSAIAAVYLDNGKTPQDLARDVSGVPPETLETAWGLGADALMTRRLQDHFDSRANLVEPRPASFSFEETMIDPVFAKDARQIHSTLKGRPFAGTDLEASEWLASHLRDIDFNTAMLASAILRMRSAPSETIQAYRSALDRWDKTEMEMSFIAQGGNMARMLVDPLNLLGAGIGKLTFMTASRVALREGLEGLAKQQLLKQAAKSGLQRAGVGALGGAVGGAVTEAGRDVLKGEEITAEGMGTMTAAGAIMGGVASFALPEMAEGALHLLNRAAQKAAPLFEPAAFPDSLKPWAKALVNSEGLLQDMNSGFYSPLEKAFNEAPDASIDTVGKVLAFAKKHGKREELRWMDLDTVLADRDLNAKISRDEVRSMLRQRRIFIERISTNIDRYMGMEPRSYAESYAQSIDEELNRTIERADPELFDQLLTWRNLMEEGDTSSVDEMMRLHRLAEEYKNLSKDEAWQRLTGWTSIDNSFPDQDLFPTWWDLAHTERGYTPRPISGGKRPRLSQDAIEKWIDRVAVLGREFDQAKQEAIRLEDIARSRSERWALTRYYPVSDPDQLRFMSQVVERWKPPGIQESSPAKLLMHIYDARTKLVSQRYSFMERWQELKAAGRKELAARVKAQVDAKTLELQDIQARIDALGSRLSGTIETLEDAHKVIQLRWEKSMAIAQAKTPSEKRAIKQAFDEKLLALGDHPSPSTHRYNMYRYKRDAETASMFQKGMRMRRSAFDKGERAYKNLIHELLPEVQAAYQREYEILATLNANRTAQLSDGDRALVKMLNRFAPKDGGGEGLLTAKHLARIYHEYRSLHPQLEAYDRARDKVLSLFDAGVEPRGMSMRLALSEVSDAYEDIIEGLSDHGILGEVFGDSLFWDERAIPQLNRHGTYFSENTFFPQLSDWYSESVYRNMFGQQGQRGHFSHRDTSGGVIASAVINGRTPLLDPTLLATDPNLVRLPETSPGVSRPVFAQVVRENRLAESEIIGENANGLHARFIYEMQSDIHKEAAQALRVAGQRKMVEKQLEYYGTKDPDYLRYRIWWDNSKVAETAFDSQNTAPALSYDGVPAAVINAMAADAAFWKSGVNLKHNLGRNALSAPELMSKDWPLMVAMGELHEAWSSGMDGLAWNSGATIRDRWHRGEGVGAAAGIVAPPNSRLRFTMSPGGTLEIALAGKGNLRVATPNDTVDQMTWEPHGYLRGILNKLKARFPKEAEEVLRSFKEARETNSIITIDVNVGDERLVLDTPAFDWMDTSFPRDFEKRLKKIDPNFKLEKHWAPTHMSSSTEAAAASEVWFAPLTEKLKEHFAKYGAPYLTTMPLAMGLPALMENEDADYQ